MTKQEQEIMEILEAYDLTRGVWSAAELAGCDPKTVKRYVQLRDAGKDVLARLVRPKLVDQFADKIEELVERSHGKVRGDVVHERLVAMGFEGHERTSRRAVERAKTAYRQGRRRSYRPWVPEPGLWMQADWAKGPAVKDRETSLFCVWLAWSRYRVILPSWDRTLGTLMSCVDASLRHLGGVPTYYRVLPSRTSGRVGCMYLVVTVRTEGNGISDVVAAAVLAWNHVVHLYSMAVFADRTHSARPSKQIIDIGLSEGHGVGKHRRVARVPTMLG